MIRINLPTSYNVSAYLIVKFPTGVMYSNQSGGMACSHPEVEGFIIPISYHLISEFNDCIDLCWDGEIMDLGPDHEKVKSIINRLNVVLKQDGFSLCYRNFIMEIDMDRLNELMEGWWPVKGKLSDEFKDELTLEFTGYIAKSNCD